MKKILTLLLSLGIFSASFVTLKEKEIGRFNASMQDMTV